MSNVAVQAGTSTLSRGGVTFAGGGDLHQGQAWLQMLAEFAETWTQTSLQLLRATSEDVI
ncbi:hypothetical protein J1614_006951 [Plenodomus biglobosus]|nr:hypothetical protein J1614_006951 [Plenodomus biglobosus]